MENVANLGVQQVILFNSLDLRYFQLCDVLIEL